MMRREFITLLGGAAAAWPLAARAQQRVRRIGMLIGVAETDTETQTWAATFRKRLDDLGWRAGGNLQIDERWSASDPDQIRVFAGELVAMKPDAIFAFSSWRWRPCGARAARYRSCSLRYPIRSAALRRKLGASRRKRHRFTNFVSTMGTKWLEVLKEIAPGPAGSHAVQSANGPLRS